MRSRTTAAYVAVLRKIKELVPGFKPGTVMADFEGKTCEQYLKVYLVLSTPAVFLANVCNKKFVANEL